ncbi:MAG: fibronectin type III domain-containing protein [Anaerolineae bacterium]|nr:fibronectin type III domain-containing protein [Anaerolineae bacterium]
MTVANPLAGDWAVEIHGVGTDPFNFAYLANNPAPNVTFDPLPLQAIDQPSVPLRWASDIGPGAQAPISLYYELITDPLSRPVSGPIVERLPLESTGTYDWDITGLATGSYRVYAQIDSNAPAVLNACPDQRYTPDPRQQGPCGLMLAQGLVMPVDRIDAPGSMRILDQIAPAPPAGFKLRAEGPSSVVGRWLANAEKDLAGYILTCSQNQGALVRSVRVSAAIEFTSPLSETARVNGLDGVPADCFVQAYDASGNLSGQSTTLAATPSANIPLPPAAVQNVQVLPGSVGDVLVQWQPSLLAYGYLLFYHVVPPDNTRSLASSIVPLFSPGAAYQADQGASPMVTYTASQALTGLDADASYNVWVVPFDADGRAGQPSETTTFTVPEGSRIYLPLINRH